MTTSDLVLCFCQVFSEPYSPLKNLVKASCNVHLAKDLEHLVSVLDLHVDRMMQIGMFAMACSADEGRMCLQYLYTVRCNLIFIDIYELFLCLYQCCIFFYHLHNIYKRQSQSNVTCKWQSHCTTCTFDTSLAY